MEKSYTFHNDPGHAWLEVPKSDLGQLGVAQSISLCSHEDEHNAYLEEDVDAEVFLIAAREAGWQLELIDSFVSGSCFVRDLPNYRS